MMQVSWLAVADMLEHARQCTTALAEPEAQENECKRATLIAERGGLVKSVAMIVAGRYKADGYTDTFYRIIGELDAGADPNTLAWEIALANTTKKMEI
jgi:hypothetical protein